MKKYSPILIIIAASLWGIDGVVLRPALYSLPVSLVVFTESTLVLLILTPFLFKKFPELKELRIKDWAAFAGVGLFGGAIGTMAITRAFFYVDYVNLSIVVLIQKLQPVFAVLLAAIVLRERPKKIFFIWASLAIFGAYLMTFGLSIPEIKPGDKTVYAALFALLAAFSFAFSTVLSKRALRNTSFHSATYLRFLFSAFFMLIIIGFTGELSSYSSITTEQYLIFLLIAFTTGGAAIFLYYYGLKNVSASTAAVCELAFPLTAVVLEYFIRQNILGPFQWAGVAILVYSIFRVTTMNRKFRS